MFYFKYLKMFWKFKFYFKPPQKSNLLIYDRQSISFASILFKNGFNGVYDTRYESVNFYIFFKTLFLKGYKNFFIEYKKIYFECVSPKIVYTAIDNNVGFFRLKKLYPNALYIADQNGLRNNYFYQLCQNAIKKKIKLYTDYFFCLGTNELYKLKKVIRGNIIPFGHTRNNQFLLNKKNKKNKIKKIIFISSGKSSTGYGDETVPKKFRKFANFKFKDDIKIFSQLQLYCKENKLRLYFLDKPKLDRYKVLHKYLRFNFNYITSYDSSKNYKLFKKNTLFAFCISTMGYEALSKGLRVASFDHTQFNHGLKKYKKNGPFWCSDKDFTTIKNTLNKVINYSEKKWGLICETYSRQIMVYDKNNHKKKNIINNLINKTDEKEKNFYKT